MIVDSHVSDAAQPDSNVIRTICAVHFRRSTGQGTLRAISSVTN
jgi:hypothetical protein